MGKKSTPLKDPQRIKIVKNGPYIVSGSIPLHKIALLPDVSDKEGKIYAKWGKIKRINTESMYSLCRCGSSLIPPFCDGTHASKKFSGKETAKKDKILNASEKCEGKNLIMRDKEELCFGAGFCHSKKGSIWELLESNNPKHDAAIKKMSRDCPAGRFVLIDKKTKKVSSSNFSKGIFIIDEVRKSVSGPLWVRGGVRIVSQEAGDYERRESVALCRCGASKNKPFCDGTHIDIDWKESQ